jgi:hypothetical protein
MKDKYTELYGILFSVSRRVKEYRTPWYKKETGIVTRGSVSFASGQSLDLEKRAGQ